MQSDVKSPRPSTHIARQRRSRRGLRPTAQPGRRRRLRPDRAHAVAQRDYDAFTRYERRASGRTYLTVVVTRLSKDWQNRNLGKWRSSADAPRMGPVAVASVTRIARTALIDAKALYRRFDRIRRALRDLLLEQGVCGPACLD